MKPLIYIKSGDIELESRLDVPLGESRPPCVLFCHPDPRHGGAMDNLILEKVNENLLKNGIATLRFNFRGVGNSTGEFTGGKSEGTDIISIVEFLSTHTLIDGSRIGIFGYSFGAWMALEATLATSKIKSVVSVACPQRWYSTFGTVEMVQPKLLISGDRDHDFPHGQFKFLSGRFTEPRQVETITGADHFFHGYEDILGELTVKFFLGTI
tara:strand:- start:63 stop:695 length:633 start_codon:yes stop_codon:yes gene_type:complete